MADRSSSESNQRGLYVALIGLFVAFVGGALAFLDPATGDGSNGGVLFRVGFGLGVIGILILLFGTLIHFATMFDRE